MKKFLATLELMSVLGVFLSIFADPDLSDIHYTVLTLLISILVFIICEAIMINISDSDKFGT